MALFTPVPSTPPTCSTLYRTSLQDGKRIGHVQPLPRHQKYPLSVSCHKESIVKFTDLDRCFTASYLKVDTKRDLVLVNLHMSAYDKGGVIRQKQLKRLNEFLKSEAEEGNYVIAGGDFNHDIAGRKISMSLVRKFQSGYTNSLTPILAEGYSFVIPENLVRLPVAEALISPTKRM